MGKQRVNAGGRGKQFWGELKEKERKKERERESGLKVCNILTKLTLNYLSKHVYYKPFLDNMLNSFRINFFIHIEENEYNFKPLNEFILYIRKW